MDSVYLETSVISYLVAAPSRDLVIAAHQQVTREWWDTERTNYELYVSQMVWDEVGRGHPLMAQQRLALIDALPILPMNHEIHVLAQEFLNLSSLPPSAATDALHIAVATVAGLEFLLTWNCRHIANPHILKKLAEIALHAGYELPVICTPGEFQSPEFTEFGS